MSPCLRKKCPHQTKSNRLRPILPSMHPLRIQMHLPRTRIRLGCLKRRTAPANTPCRNRKVLGFCQKKQRRCPTVVLHLTPPHQKRKRCIPLHQKRTRNQIGMRTLIKSQIFSGQLVSSPPKMYVWSPPTGTYDFIRPASKESAACPNKMKGDHLRPGELSAKLKMSTLKSYQAGFYSERLQPSHQ